MKETLTVIASCLAAIGGLAGIASLIKVVATLRNEKNAGAIANDAATIKSLQSAIDGFEDVIEDLKKERNEAKAEARQYREDREVYRQACITAEGGFCLNYGCPLRDPARGLGAAWMREHGQTSDIGGNYKQLKELIQEKGIKLCESK